MSDGRADTPSDQPLAPVATTRKYYEPNDKNRMLGYRLWFRVRVERGSKAEAWRGVFPTSDCSDESAARQCRRFLKWYEKEYPPTFDQAAAAIGLSPYFLMERFYKIMTAKIWEWDKEQERRVETDRDDLKLQLNGLKEFIKLVSKSEQWRKEFLEQKDDAGTRMNLPPEHATVEEWEEWAKANDLRGELDRAREAATKERDRRLAAEGRKLPTPPFTNGENGKHQ